MANLTQLRMLEDLDGFLLVDKPAGISFASVVKAVKRKFNLVKVGHGGSLEAMASGLFILLINDANKFAADVMGADRAYEGRLRLGYATDTGDIYGRPVPPPERTTPLSELKGDVFQVEPRFCSIRKEGTAAYEIADTGEHKQFLAHIYRFTLDGGDFSLVASKNLIVRALAMELGASVESLRRIRVGKFEVGRAIPFDRLLELDARELPSVVTPLSEALAK